jgi:4,5-dihydroxyphthalate decarboxylase
MSTPSLTLACRRSERTAAILDGSIKPPEVALSALEVSDGQKLFSGILTGDYDVGEFSLAELVDHVASDRAEILAIPVFPTRAFRHGFLFCNTRSNIHTPEDLIGKRVGFRQWVETASVWIRGILTDEYQVSPGAAHWYAVTMHHWDSPAEERMHRLGDFNVHWLENLAQNPVESAEVALLDGTIDVLGMVPAPHSLGRDERIRRLFTSHTDIEVNYFRKTRIFPIMHVLVARTALVERHPDLPRILFELFVETKKSYASGTSRAPLVWQGYDSAQERKLFDCDPWEYGVRPNAHVIQKFLSYCSSQGIGKRQLAPHDLFFENTLELTE